MRVKDKVIIVTGASRGIGYAVSDKLLSEGAKLVACASNQKNADKAVVALKGSHPNAMILGLGVNNNESKEVEKAVKKVHETFGKIDVLINNAGITTDVSFFDMTEEEFVNVMNVNVTGIFRWCKAVAPIMKDNDGGSIINTSSMVATFGQKSGCSYAASKAAVNGLTKSLAKELGQYGIRVNAVAPGVTKTDMVAAIPDKFIDALAAMTPLGRVGTPKELAGAYVYLASDESTFTNGTIIGVDGGLVM